MRTLALCILVMAPCRHDAGRRCCVSIGAVLLGDQNLESYKESNSPGVVQACQYAATTSGTASDVEVYANGGSSATKVMVGLYSDAAGKPESLLTAGSLSALHAGAWNDITLGSSAAFVKGRSYWIALLGGQLKFGDAAYTPTANFVAVVLLPTYKSMFVVASEAVPEGIDVRRERCRHRPGPVCLALVAREHRRRTGRSGHIYTDAGLTL